MSWDMSEDNRVLRERIAALEAELAEAKPYKEAVDWCAKDWADIEFAYKHCEIARLEPTQREERLFRADTFLEAAALAMAAPDFTGETVPERRAKIAALEAENAALATKNHALHIENAELREARANLEAENAQVKELLSKARLVRAEAHAMLGKIEDFLCKTTGERQGIKENLHALAAENSALREDNARLVEAVQRFEREVYGAVAKAICKGGTR